MFSREKEAATVLTLATSLNQVVRLAPHDDDTSIQAWHPPSQVLLAPSPAPPIAHIRAI